MIKSGLTSITFRKLSPDEIVRWAAEARLDGIEWGGDVHVPPGEVDTARRVAAMTSEAGLVVSSYGSYYRVGHDEPDLFSPVLETALALDAPVIRVWAGRVASSEADEAYRAGVAADARRITEAAHDSGIRIATEWHGNTLTDTPESAQAFFEAVDRPDLGTYWQPRTRGGGVDDCLRELDVALPRLAGLHVFYWDAESGRKLPLEEGPGLWRPCLSRAAQAGDMFALLEFVIDGDPQQMLSDAAALRGWLGEMEKA